MWKNRRRIESEETILTKVTKDIETGTLTFKGKQRDRDGS